MYKPSIGCQKDINILSHPFVKLRDKVALLWREILLVVDGYQSTPVSARHGSLHTLYEQRSNDLYRQ